MSSVSIVTLLGQMNTPRLRALFAQDPKRAADWVYAAALEGVSAAQTCYGRMPRQLRPQSRKCNP